MVLWKVRGMAGVIAGVALGLGAGLQLAAAGAVAPGEVPPFPGAPGRDSEIDPLLAAARQAREAGEMVRSAALYARVMDLDPGNRVALYNAGIILENAGKPELAVTVWRRALAADPGDLYAWEHLIRNLAATGGLDTEIVALTSRMQDHPEAQVPPLALALALQAADRWQESIELLESYLVDHPASNIAYTFLKDAFPTSISRRVYLEGLAARARRPGAPDHLKLLHIRLLLERGRPDEARALAAGTDWSSDLATTLLARADLLREGAPAGDGATPRVAAAFDAAVAAGGKSDDGGGEGAATPASGAPAGTQGAASPSAFSERPQAPDFGPDDPRSATHHLDRSLDALSRRDESEAARELRRALHASPLLLQPRILLALLLEQEGRPAEARATLRGPVEVSPYDLYQQAWRTVRDDFVDPEHRGVDIYRLRRQALRSLATVAGAKAEIGRLLAALDDPYAHLFAPDLFAGYLLAPNANRLSGPREPELGEIADPWIPIPEAVPSVDVAALAPPGPPEAGTTTGPASGGDWAGRGRTLRVKPLAEQLDLATEQELKKTLTGGGAEAPGAAREPATPSPSATPAGEATPSAGPDDAGAGAGPARDPGVRALMLGDGLGYVAIPSLGGLDVPRQVEQALAHVADARGVILDLRGNHGGDGDVAVEVAARFLPRGTEVCTYLTRRGPERRVTSWENPDRPRVPLAVLVDGETASAAELLAAALRDRAGARLVGAPSAGKGVGQKALLLGDGSGLSLTRFRIQAPSGASWHGTGLQPDLAAAPRRGDREDTALKAARALLDAAAPGSS